MSVALPVVVAIARALARLCTGALAAAAIWSAPAAAAEPSWSDPKLLEAAKKEGSLVIYTSLNEEEGLPIWKVFEQETGLKVDYIRGSDSQMIGRILIENRGGRPAWDIVMVTSVQRLPPALLAQIDPPDAPQLFPAARDPGRRWYGFAANYDVPAYNSKFVKPADLPRTYEEFAKKTEWAGHAVINESDTEWVLALQDHYGEAKAREVIGALAATLKPAIVSGHLAVARALGAGEYWVALNNYVNLTINVKLAGSPTDFWAIEPIGVFHHSVGVDAQAPHPNAARLAVNFLLSKEGQHLLTTRGRIPTRPDVETNPPGVLKALHAKTVIPTVYNVERGKKADALFKELMLGRSR
ncbi:MAG: iron(III) transport system substrate-binding protein [Alphaproteobacteria bacterium]|nr:iron(III) transport system substrate-binding protein [Alphaproteobacteria bacterium]